MRKLFILTLVSFLVACGGGDPEPECVPYPKDFVGPHAECQP